MNNLSYVMQRHVNDILNLNFFKNSPTFAAPTVFRAAYTVFKTFIDEGTAKKFVLLDGKLEGKHENILK